MQRTVRLPPVIFLPSHLARISVQVLAADVMMLADLGAAPSRL
jgi:hypothetical protein